MQADYFDQLQEEVEREVMACIGCNDCMLACPLPEKRFVTIAELNAGVLAKTIEAPNVAAFVQACTQCQQCIPACPADLHRADMVLWNKMKVENAAPNQVMLLQVAENVEALAVDSRFARHLSNGDPALQWGGSASFTTHAP